MPFQPVMTRPDQQIFRAGAQETPWDVLSPAAGGTSINGNKIISRKANWFEANGAPVVINDTGTAKQIVARMKFNDGNGINVNFTSNEGCVVAKYPSVRDFPENNPIKLTFANPVRGAGAYVSFVSNARSLYDGRSITAHMYILLNGKPAWEPAICQSTEITGDRVGVGMSATAPFVAGTATGADLIKAVSFEVAVMGNFEFLTISRLYWVP